MQYISATVVIVSTLLSLAAVIALSFIFSSKAVHTVCLLTTNGNCETVAWHTQAMKALKDGIQSSTVKSSTAACAGTLGYHGPFAGVILAAMPSTKSVAHGFWTQPFSREADASAFCTSAVAAIEDGHNSGSLPALQVHVNKNCQRCIQKEAGTFTPSEIMTCLAPIQFRGYDL